MYKQRNVLFYIGNLLLKTSPSRLRRATSPIEGRPWHTGKPRLFARGSPTRGAGAKRLRGCTKDSLTVSRSIDGEV